MIDLGAPQYQTKTANEEGVQCILCDPSTGEELLVDGDENKPVAVWVVGKDSAEYKSFQSEIESKFRGKKFPTGAKAKALALDLLARCTRRFENVVVNGKEVGSTHADAVKFYKNVEWAKEQVDEFIADRANFLGN